MLKARLHGLLIWAVIATIAGAIGHFGFGVNFWLVAALTIMSLIVNGWIHRMGRSATGRLGQ
jgi:hypothetical protein